MNSISNGRRRGPVRNEAGNVAPLVAEIAAALAGHWPFEVVYVNDGSTDGPKPSCSG